MLHGNGDTASAQLFGQDLEAQETAKGSVGVGSGYGWGLQILGFGLRVTDCGNGQKVQGLRVDHLLLFALDDVFHCAIFPK